MTTIHNGQPPAQPVHDHIHPTFNRRFDDHAFVAGCLPRFDPPSRILLINGAPRCDGSWAGEAGMTWRLTDLARAALEAEGIQTEVLDLGLLPQEPDRQAAARAIRERWRAAHGVILLSPSDWGATEAMLRDVFQERELVDGAYGIVVHGDAAGVADARRGLAERFDGLGLVDSDSFGPLTGYAGYVECEQNEQDEQDGPPAPQPDYEEQARNVARAVAKAVTYLRAGRLA